MKTQAELKQLSKDCYEAQAQQIKELCESITERAAKYSQTVNNSPYYTDLLDVIEDLDSANDFLKNYK